MELFQWLALALVVMLGPMILIHELGHFLTARRAGARVLEFGLGFPPRLLTLFREEGTIEVDGQRMLLPGSVRLPPGLAPGQDVEVRLEPGPESLPRVAEIRRAAVSEQEPAPPAPWRRGRLTALELGTIYSLNLLPLGGFVRMLGEEDPSHPQSLAARPKRWRLVVLLSGALFNILVAFLLMIAAYATGVPTRAFVQIQEVVPDSPAEKAGLLPGDIVTAVNGDRLEEGSTELREWIRSSPGEPLELTVLREKEFLTLTATPVLTDGRGFLGIGLQDWPDPASAERYSLPRATIAAGKSMAVVVLSILNLPRMVSSGQVSAAEAVRPVGIPGILGFLGYALKQSMEAGIPFMALQVTALISLAVGMTNLLPLPALDGGRALFVLIEAIRGRRISPETEAKVHMAGMVILIGISLVIITMDIVNPIIPWSWLSR
ncbi:MAG: site-2 protease family protein [Thermoflexales bacterium]|nr:site-2 protease family protein [Thermoflexales bacterium]